MAEDNRPFPIQLEVEFLDRMSEPVRDGRAKSVSEIIRAALERFDLDQVVVVRPPQLNISVRLSAEIRKNLKRVARTKHTSVGQLVRAAIEQYLPQLESGAAGQLEMAITAEQTPAASAPVPGAAKAPAVRKRTSRKKSMPARPKPGTPKSKPRPGRKKAGGSVRQRRK